MIEAGFPDATLCLKPALCRCERAGAQLADADPTGFAGDYDLALFQHPDMLHEAGECHVMSLCEVANAGRPDGELRDHRSAGAVGEGMKDTIKVSHMAN